MGKLSEYSYFPSLNIKFKHSGLINRQGTIHALKRCQANLNYSFKHLIDKCLQNRNRHFFCINAIQTELETEHFSVSWTSLHHDFQFRLVGPNPLASPSLELLNSHSVRLGATSSERKKEGFSKPSPHRHKLPFPMCYIERISCSQTIKVASLAAASAPSHAADAEESRKKPCGVCSHTKPTAMMTTKCAPVYIRRSLACVLRYFTDGAVFDLYSGRWTACAEGGREEGTRKSQTKKAYRQINCASSSIWARGFCYFLSGTDFRPCCIFHACLIKGNNKPQHSSCWSYN